MAYKSNSQMITRLLEIVRRLTTGEILTINGLLNDYNVTKRTLQRDLEKIKQRLPISKTENGGYVMDTKKKLSTEDLQVIEILKSYAKGQGKEFESRAKRLFESMKKPEDDVFFANINTEDISSHTKILAKIEKAIKNKNDISFEYNTEEYGKIKVDSQPVRIINDQGFWYLLGYWSAKECVRKYHLKSIKNITVHESTFEIPHELSQKIENAINIWFDADEEPFEVKFYVPKEFKKHFERKPINKTQSIEPLSDGGIYLSLKITHEMEIIPFAKSWLPNAILVEPQFIVDKLKDVAKRSLEIYEEMGV